jgi:signal transduction histidine kinase
MPRRRRDNLAVAAADLVCAGHKGFCGFVGGHPSIRATRHGGIAPVPPGYSDREHHPRQPTPTGPAGGFSLRTASTLVLAPAALALVVLASSVVATGRAGADTVVAGVGLLLVIALGWIGTRALTGSLGRLRDSTLHAANRALPGWVEQLRAPRALADRTPEELARDADDPVDVEVHDELGQVAYAVNSIYREALLLAAQQAQLRGDVNAMVLSLARRSQALVDRMSALLTEVTRAETDPERLTRLFELERLAARMRRNDENMLTLAGVDAGPVRDDYLKLSDVLAAARAEIEQHPRVEAGTVDDDVAVAAHATTDVIRLLAELLDNATRFSPPSTAVLVDGRRIGDYVLVEIEDRGLGMSPSQLEDYNARLAAPQEAEVSDCRMMGLGVVGRLAERHQIRVTLRANSYGGTVVSVTLPTQLLVLPTRNFDLALPHARRPELPSAAPPGWPLTGTPSAGRPAAALPSGPAAGAILGTGSQLGALPPRTHALPAGSSASGEGPAHAATTEAHPAAHASPAQDLPRHTELGQALAASEVARPLALAGPPGYGSGTPVAGDGDEPVIFKELRARWFGGNPVPADGSDPSGKESSEPMNDEYGWRSAGDDGWAAASAAAQPMPAGNTPAGLPRRTPAAQLVPGGVPAEPSVGRRDPDEVRGVLAAYHRGVRRGRGGGEAQSSGHPRSADEETH